MVIDKSTKNYFLVVRRYDTKDEILQQIESFLDTCHMNYGISLKEYIYNKQEYINEFYNIIYGKE